MKKYLIALWSAALVLCTLCATALASDPAPLMNITNAAATGTDMSFQVSVENQSDPNDAVLVTVYAATGKMKSVEIYNSIPEDGILVELKDVADDDSVKAIWTDGNFSAVRVLKKILKPTKENDPERNIEEADIQFDQTVMDILNAETGIVNGLDIDQSDENYVAKAIESLEAAAAKRLIVKSGADLPIEKLQQEYGVQKATPRNALGYSILLFDSARNADACERYLAALPDVQYVEQDVIMQSGPITKQDGFDAESEYLSWGAEAIKADVLATYLRDQNINRTVTVAVIDTGVEMDHPLFAGRLLNTGYDFIDNDTIPNDEHSHGSHVSGIIVDCTRVLNSVQIMPIRVLGKSGGGSDLGVVQGIQWAVDHGADVINLSLGGSHSNYMDEAIANAVSNGVTVVVAAGNEGDNVMAHCPAHIVQAITVGATDQDFEKANFSNFGASLDVTAPGVDIYSAVPGKDYAFKSGTSMATPYVAAAASMLQLLEEQKRTPDEIQDALKSTATDLGDPGWDAQYGYGMINLEPFTHGGAWPDPPAEPTVTPPPTREHVYELFDMGLDWNEAKAYCERLGGHLMTVTSEKEQKTLEDLLQTGTRNIYWLGGYRVSSDRADDFAWVTGEAFSYTNWRTGEPNNSPKTGSDSEDSLMAYRNGGDDYFGRWNDHEHDGDDDFYALDNTGFICEWDDEAPIIVEGIYAILYEDGELVFQNNNRPRSAKAVTKIYPLSGAILSMSANHNGDVGTDYASWYDQASDIKKVTFLDPIQPVTTSQWFHGCENLTSITGLRNLDTSKVTDMSMMFSECYNLTDLDVGGFDTSNVVSMSQMFYDCEKLVSLNLTSFKTSRVTNMNEMFRGCKALERVFVRSEDDFNVGQVTDSDNMFRGCEAIVGTYGTKYDREHIDKEYARPDGLDQQPPYPGYFTDPTKEDGSAYAIIYTNGDMVFQLSNVPDPNLTVRKQNDGSDAIYKIETVKFGVDPDYALWYDLRSYINTVIFADQIRPLTTSQWFHGCENLKEVRNIERLDTSAVQNMRDMFSECSSLSVLDVSGLKTGNVTDMSGMFFRCSGLSALDVSGFDTSNVIDMSRMFQECSGLTELPVSGFNTVNVRNMSNLFRDCAKLERLDVSGFKTGETRDMSYMFAGCARLPVAQTGGFDTINVTDMSYMFYNCSRLSALDVSGFNTENVLNMACMFQGCAGLPELDVSGFETGKVTDMNHMFSDCRNIGALAIVDFDTRNVTDMSYMFYNCDSLMELNFIRFRMDDATGRRIYNPAKFTADAAVNMSYFLAECDGLTELDVSGLNPIAAEDMTDFFADCDKLTVIYAKQGSFPVDSVTVSENMFVNSVKLEGGRGTKYDANHLDKTYARIDYGAREPGYFTDPNMVILSFDGNGTDEEPVEGTMENMIFSIGETRVLPECAFTREGYEFSGWNTEPDGSGEPYADQSVIVLEDDLTLYAQWEYSYMDRFYVILYTDGELAFQWTDVPESGRNVKKIYITDREGYDINGREPQNNYRAWYNEREDIISVNFLKRIQPDSIAQWFEDCENLKEIRNLEKLDTSLVKDMSKLFQNCSGLVDIDLSVLHTDETTDVSYLFHDCENLETVNISGWNTGKFARTRDMFSGCEKLKTIYASASFDASGAENSRNMFEDCESLVGGQGTAYDEDHVDAAYARVDGGASRPGYFTSIEN